MKNKVVAAFSKLLQMCTQKSKVTILSYSNESIVKPEEMNKIMEPYQVDIHIQNHSRYNVRGDEHTRDAVKTTEEFLYVIKI